MIPSPGSIEKIINSRFANLHRVGEEKSVIRCERKHAETTVAVYYFETNDVISAPTFSIAAYQESLLARDFYQRQGPLQWNIYLVFLLSDERFGAINRDQRVRLIQQDEDFARKFVVPAQRLKEFVDESIGSTSQQAVVLESVVDSWKEVLDAKGLAAIYGTKPFSNVIAQIKAGTLDNGYDASSAVAVEQTFAIPHLKTLRLGHYRRRPILGDYSLKAVNLLKGPNGSGKTSFLEAIELCLCGGTLVNAAESQASIELHLSNGSVETYEDNAKKYRARDKQLYNRQYRSGNNMPGSFARYNFFSSDAAFHLSRDEEANEINTSFQRLLLGDEASHVSDRLTAFDLKLESEAKALEKTVSGAVSTVDTVTLEINRIEQSLGDPVDKAITGRSVAKQVGLDLGPATISDAEILESLTRYLAVLSSHIESIDWIVPLSLSKLDAEFSRLRVLEERIATLGRSRKKIRDQRDALSRKREETEVVVADLYLAERIASIAGITEISMLLHRQPALRQDVHIGASIGTLADQLVTLDASNHDFSADSLSVVVAKAKSVVTARAKLVQKRRSTLDKVGSLKTTIRELGHELVELLPDEGTCPLCGEDHGEGNLRGRLHNIDEVESAAEVSLRLATRSHLEAEQDWKTAEQLLTLRTQLDEALASSGRTLKSTTIQNAVNELENYRIRQRQASYELDKLETMAGAVEKIGQTFITTVALSERVKRTTNLDFLSENPGSIVDRRITFEEMLGEIRDQELIAVKELDAANADFAAQTRSAFDGLQEPDHVVPLISTRASAIERAKKDIVQVAMHLIIERDDDVRDLRGRIDSSVRQLQTAVAFNRSLKESSQTLHMRRKELESAQFIVASSREELERISIVRQVLTQLLQHKGIELSTETALEKYRSAILAIFRSIHSPPEFRDLLLGKDKKDEIQLVHIDGSKVKISQVSTGQRAALALSIFLALNRSVKDRLNLILIDDPVSNIDDLNSLAFLDFLRNVAMTGTQIVFATADTKLARLFEMKFAFLGEHDFQILSFNATESNTSSEVAD